MISRYEIPEISTIWSDQNKFEYFYKVELALIKALEGKVIPEKIHNEFQNLKIDPERIKEIEQDVHHDVIAFCSSITEQVDSKWSKYFHFGVTSSDIIDTALMLQLKDSLTITLSNVKELRLSLLAKAKETTSVLALGRSHGIYAEPMIFAQKFLMAYAEVSRREEELKRILQNELTMQTSGAVGNYSVLTPEIERNVATELGLGIEPVSTQVIPRDRIANIIGSTSLLAASLDRLAIELRHLQHSDVDEVSEGFSKNQKGSSTMPHKKNPISGENISGLVRILKSHYQVSLDNITLWHERDISHSSAERMYLPDHFGVLNYVLRRMKSTIDNLVIHKENIENKVRNHSNYLSSIYLHHLLANSDHTREELYRVVQNAAFGSSHFYSLKESLEAELIKHNIKVELPQTDFPHLKVHYQKQYEKVQDRVLQIYPVGD